MRMTNIYYMKDPLCDAVEYVGRTDLSIEYRLKTHIAEAKRGDTSKKCQWIRELIEQGREPTIHLLEECSKAVRAEREKYWIKKYLDEGQASKNWIGKWWVISPENSERCIDEAARRFGFTSKQTMLAAIASGTHIVIPASNG